MKPPSPSRRFRLSDGVPVCALSSAVLCFCGWAAAQTVKVQEIGVGPSGVSIEVSSDRSYYHILDAFDLATGTTGGALDIQSGANGLARLSDPRTPGRSGFYQVRSQRIETPGDADGDQIDDIFEMGNVLNPLDPADAVNKVVLDGKATTQIDAYRNNYEVGWGMHDVTGLATGGGMMGYAEGAQISTGIHDRQWARAFIVMDRMPPYRRVVHVVVDNGQVFQSIYQGVHDRIRADNELNPYYSFENIVLSATHTHGAAGGHSHFALYHATIGGYSWRTYDALVHGIYMAIKKAHRDLQPGAVKRNRGQLANANENRSPKVSRKRGT